jgi:hypothetical protein
MPRGPFRVSAFGQVTCLFGGAASGIPCSFGTWARRLFIRGRCVWEPLLARRLGKTLVHSGALRRGSLRLRHLGKALVHSSALPPSPRRGQREGLTAASRSPEWPRAPRPPTRAWNIARRVGRRCRPLADWAWGRPEGTGRLVKAGRRGARLTGGWWKARSLAKRSRRGWGKGRSLAKRSRRGWWKARSLAKRSRRGWGKARSLAKRSRRGWGEGNLPENRVEETDRAGRSASGRCSARSHDAQGPEAAGKPTPGRALARDRCIQMQSCNRRSAGAQPRELSPCREGASLSRPAGLATFDRATRNPPPGSGAAHETDRHSRNRFAATPRCRRKKPWCLRTKARRGRRPRR